MRGGSHLDGGSAGFALDYAKGEQPTGIPEGAGMGMPVL